MHQIEVLTDARCIVGEGPLWDAASRRLWMVDIQGKRLRSIDWQTGGIADTVLSQQPGFLALCQDGQLLAGCEDGVYKVIGNQLQRFSSPVSLKGDRFNEGKVGPDGNLYLGTFSRNFSAAFYRMDTKGTLTELFDGVGNSNGLDWDQLGYFYYNDTPLGRTDRFTFLPNGTPADRQTVCRYDRGAPDGMTIDTDGNLWTALWGSGTVVCVDPRTGKVLETIELPVSQPSSCAFAGDDLKTLVITSAAHNVHLKDEPLAGATFAVRTGAQGLPIRKIKLEE